MDKIIQKNIHDGEICIITLNRPDVLNSLNRPLVEVILKSIEECQDDKSIRSIILTGNGRGFCAGADLTGGDWPIEEGWSSGKSNLHSISGAFPR
jgi:enoyl-CoA hydratase/carnithine racemase